MWTVSGCQSLEWSKRCFDKTVRDGLSHRQGRSHVVMPMTNRCQINQPQASTGGSEANFAQQSGHSTAAGRKHLPIAFHSNRPIHDDPQAFPK
ncbi:MAG: hypothetical protein CMJ64_09630 [Planctomycetaceae bacterium]|nr:hypothetical protein [Planctomycetaceae bacterium]